MVKKTRFRLSQHFVLEEFDSHDGAQVPFAHRQAIANLVHWWLEPMREEFGAVRILSGYRSFAHNQSVGGASKSVHLLRTPLPDRGRRSTQLAAAADVLCAKGSPREWSAWAGLERQAQPNLGNRDRGGIGTYLTFLHLDTGPWRRWAS